MKILAVGDLVGEGGVKKLKELLPRIREEEKIDFVIVNAENSAGGMGITTKIFNELKELDIDAVTMGNHTWGKKDIFNIIENKSTTQKSTVIVAHATAISAIKFTIPKV